MSKTRPEINIYPSTYPPSSLPTNTYDVIVIGGGPTGEGVALVTSAGGLSTLLIESELVGGECPYWLTRLSRACVPSKALLRPAETIEGARAVGGARERMEVLAQKYGVRPSVDLEGVWARRDRFTKGWDDTANVKMMLDGGVDVVHGFGAVLGEKRVGVTGWHGERETVEVQAKLAVVVATGSEPVVPAIEGLKEAGFWTPREAVSAKEVPGHLIVLGAGAVGVEVATAYREFGSEVTLITTGRVLSKVAEEASRRVEEGLRKSGVNVRVSPYTKNVKREDGKVTVTFSDGTEVTGTEILVATGRRARTVGVGLDKVGAPSEGAWVDVDESMCARSVSSGWLYAAGDTNGISPTTHMGKYQAVVTGNSIVAKSKGTYDSQLAGGKFNRVTHAPSTDATPQVVFSDPQVAWVGLSAKQAQQKGLKAREVSVKMQGPGTFLHAEGYDGWAQWVVEEGGRIVGAVFVGREVNDLLHASTVAIVNGLSWRQMFHAVPSFPTPSEVYTSLVEACAASEG